MNFPRFSAILLTSSLLFSACVKKNYDSPPDTSMIDPGLTVSCSVKTFFNEALGYNYALGQYRVLGDSIISGIVIADDRSGNFYKQIVIQDDSAGMVIALDKTYVYADYPIGRRVYIKTKGLLLYNYNGTPEILYSVVPNGGSFTTTGIPASLIGNYLVKGSYPHTVTPIPVSVLDLFSGTSQYYNRLIKLSNMQFTDDSKGVVYAASTASGAFSSSRNVTDCSHTVDKIVMYNSSFANFQPYITPTGNGDLTFVCSNYKNTLQLLIRDTTDVKFTGDRCP